MHLQPEPEASPCAEAVQGICESCYHCYCNLTSTGFLVHKRILTGLTPDSFPAEVWGLAEPSKFSHLSCIKVKEIQGSLTSQMVALALTTKVQEFFGAAEVIFLPFSPNAFLY